MQSSLKAVKVDLINHCNAKCPFCPYHGSSGTVTTLLKEHREPFSKLTLADIEMVIRGCEEIGARPQFRFSGKGEATMHPEFDAIMLFLSRHGYRTRLITNGLLLARHAAMLAACETEVVLSIHGTEAVHDAVIGQSGALEKAEAGLDELLRRKAPVEISIILTRENIEEMGAIVARYAARDLKVRVSHNFDPKVRATLSAARVRAALDLVQKSFPAVRALPELSGGALAQYYGTSQFVLAPHACTRHAAEIEIDSDGTVSVCGSAAFGTVRDGSFARAFSSTTRMSFLKIIADELSSPEGLGAARCDRCCYQSQP